MPPGPDVNVLQVPLAGRKLTPKQWAQIERFLDDWKRETLAAAARHPAKSYQLGVEQVKAFADLLANVGTVRGATGMFGGDSLTLREGQAWSRRYLLHELDGALSKFIDRIKSELLYGLRSGENPTVVASRLYDATHDASVNWRMIARTEMVRANAAGRLRACADLGYDQVWCPPHIGACRQCKRLIEGRIFNIEQVLEVTNYGRAEGTWQPCIPLHPQCRHSWLPYDPDVYAAAMGGYQQLEEAGLTNEAVLDELFDESGQLKPGVDPAMFDAAKTMDPYAEVLAAVIHKMAAPAAAAPVKQLVATELIRSDLYQRAVDPEKVEALFHGFRSGRIDPDQLPPVELSQRPDGTYWVTDGQHRIEAYKLLGWTSILALVKQGLSWGEEAQRTRDAIAKTYSPLTDSDAFADMPKLRGAEHAVNKTGIPLVDEILASDENQEVPPLAGPCWTCGSPDHWSESDACPGPQLEPLLFDGLRPRPETVERLTGAWARAAGDDWQDWSSLYLPAYGGPATAVIDYPRLRAARPAWKGLADTDMHFALVLASLHAHDGAELAPGRPLQLRINPETTPGIYTAAVGSAPDSLDVLINPADRTSPAWDVREQAWLGGIPFGDPADLAKTHPNYGWRPAALSNPDGLPVGNVADWLTNPPIGTSQSDPLLLTEEEFLAKSGAANVGWHVAPASARQAILEHGLLEAQPNTRWARYGIAAEPAGVYVWTDRSRALKWARDLARLTGHTRLAANDVWRVDLQGLADVHRDPVLGDQGAIYIASPRIPASHLQLEETAKRALVDVDVAKGPAAAAANAGVEHWITVHPNGPEEKGQPVLVRNGSDGTMTVIGGAGGNLNMLRLDPARRIDDSAKAKGKKVEEHVSREEAEASAAQREQEVAQAREQLAKLSEARGQRQDELHGYLRDQLGIDLDTQDPKARRKMLAKIRTSALRTLAYGSVSARDVNDSPPAGDFDRPENPEGTGRPLDDTDRPESSGSEESARAPRPSMAMTADQAKTVLDSFLDISHLTKQGAGHRKVLSGEASASDANQIDFTSGGQDGRDERRGKAVEQQARTDLSRTLAEHADQKFRGKKGGYDTKYKQAAVQGAFDSLDAFSHSVLGQSTLTPDAQKLLGVAGAAQLVAYQIQQETKGVGLDKVSAALKDLTDQQERAVNERGIARMQTALRRASQAQTELAASERGESLYTTTMARSIASEKVQEAKRGLGMMVGGLEATSALKVALERQAADRIKVGGWESPAKIKEAAGKARVKVHDSDITRIGTGNYTLTLPADRLQGLMRQPEPVNQAYRDRLEQIRTGKDLDAEIEANQTGPGMAHELDANQAKGKMFLLAAGSAVLAFDPGVGKTHTALGAAETLMHDEPGAGHKVLITAPTNVLRSWQDTIAAQGNGRTVQVIDEGSTKKKQQQFSGDADYTIVSYESLKSPSIRKLIKDNPRSINIADELQKSKNDESQNHGAVQDAVDSAREVHGDNTHFFGLSGTPVEKSVNDLRTMQALARRAKGKETVDRKTAERKYGKLGQDEHIARGDKIRQFRQGLDEDLFRLTAQDAGNDLPEPARTPHKVKLDAGHKAAIQDRVNAINRQIADFHARKTDNPDLKFPVKFGGRDQLMDALYNHEDSAIARSVADEIDKTGTFTHAGGSYDDGQDHAGEYAHKHVVFGASETSRALFGRNWNAAGAQRAKGGLHAELERRGHKVFVGHGSMTSADNEASYKAFLAHKGKAVFLTNDKNNAGISLQFGDNKGNFQHGATHMHHFTRPVNNATIQQREARILRKGAEAPVRYHTYSADTPIEQRLQETLDREKRTQDLAANSEQQVAGADTLAHHLAARGRVKPARRTADAA